MPKKLIHSIIYAILALVLWFTYSFNLSQVGLQEYDSVKNFYIIKDIANGDFSAMFQHGSPTFFLFFSFFYKIFPSFLALEYVNNAVNVIAVFIFTQVFAQHFSYSFWQKCLLLVYLGLCTYFVYGTRSFTIESMTLLCFAAMLWAYFNKTKLQLFWILTAIMLTINYKILLFFPVIALHQSFLFLQTHQYSVKKTYNTLLNNELQIKFIKYLGQILLFFATPFLVYILLGMMLGVSWKAYPAHWFFVLIMRKNLNPWQESTTLHFDIDFYFQYLLNFESPLLLAGLFFWVYFSWKTLQELRQDKKMSSLKKDDIFTKQVFLLIAVLFTLLEMSILPKAPRGILLILPMLYLFAFEFLRYFTEQITSIRTAKILFSCLVLSAIAYQYCLIYTHIYAYSSTNYPKIADYLRQNNITKLATTVGINFKPFAPENTTVTPILFEKEAKKLQEQGYQYCLIDDYHRLVEANVFDSLRSLPAVIEFPEPTLYSPLLYLEHCEFTGNTFQEALSTQEIVKNSKIQLKLVRFLP